MRIIIIRANPIDRYEFDTWNEAVAYRTPALGLDPQPAIRSSVRVKA